MNASAALAADMKRAFKIGGVHVLFLAQHKYRSRKILTLFPLNQPQISWKYLSTCNLNISTRVNFTLNIQRI